VIGDVILDRFFDCIVFRDNLELPSNQIVDVCSMETRYGGSTNVANILGTFCPNRVDFYSLLTKNDSSLINGVPKQFTLNAIIADFIEKQSIPVKDRFIEQDTKRYITRIDYDKCFSEFNGYPDYLYDELLTMMQQNMSRSYYNVLVIPDYAKGFISDYFISRIKTDLTGCYDSVVVNCRPSVIRRYIEWCNHLTCNMKEFTKLCKMYSVNDSKIYNRMKYLSLILHLDSIIVTNGSRGLYGYSTHGHGFCVGVPHYVESLGQTVVGAGDVILSSYAFMGGAYKFEFCSNSDEFLNVLKILSYLGWLKVKTQSNMPSLDSIKRYGKLIDTIECEVLR
jgi:bifunctional ADP-heptose synthase (sugar kinase/adenylyltransferase)